MSAASLGLRTGSYGSLQQHVYLHNHNQSGMVRKPSKLALSVSREKERFPPLLFRFLVRRKVAMLLLFLLALLVFVFGSFITSKESNVQTITEQIDDTGFYTKAPPEFLSPPPPRVEDTTNEQTSSKRKTATRGNGNRSRFSSPRRPRPRHHSYSHSQTTVSSVVPVKHSNPWGQHCENFAFPPPPPPDGRRIGPRPCPVCYLSVEDAKSGMPSSPTVSPVLQNLTYVHNKDPVKVEEHAGSGFGGFPSLKERNDSFDIKESMEVHCGFVKGIKPGRQTGFDIDEADLVEMEKSYDVIVASGIFGNYDVIQQPKNVSEAARKNIPFFMFIDEETETFMRNASVLDNSMKVGLWKIIVVHNIPFEDSRRNGKVPKLLLHRLFPNVRYSIWIDGKLKLVVDPYQVLERFLWRENTTFSISRHYRRFDVFEEAEANKAAGKYDNSSIDFQIDFYRKEGLTPYTEAKLPITSDVPEGCVIIREHIPITNLFSCLWFNDVDRFTSRDQLSFSTVRDKIAARVNWSINMFLDCERRNFVIQTYHRDLLEQMSPPVIPVARARTALPARTTPVRPPPRSRRGRGDKRASSRRHRKLIPGGVGYKNSFNVLEDVI